MKLIESKAEYIPQEEGLEGIYKQIELAGRTAYHSLDKITSDSAKSFVDRMIKSKHGAALEHGTVYLKVEDAYEDNKPKGIFPSGKAVSTEMYPWLNTPYCKINKIPSKKYSNVYDAYITTNLRYIWEKELGDLQGIHNEFLIHMCPPTEFHEKRYTMRFTCSRAIAQELTRHRAFSFLMESQRYINYSREKHGGGITFIKPSWFKENQLSLDLKAAQSSEINGAVFYERPYKAYWIGTDAEGFDWYKEDFFIHSCQVAEQCYLLMLEEGATPQQARDVLPNATKTELIMTGFASDWRFFFDLRFYGETGKPHPDMELLAGKAREEFIKVGLWDNIMKYPSKFD